MAAAITGMRTITSSRRIAAEPIHDTAHRLLSHPAVSLDVIDRADAIESRDLGRVQDPVQRIRRGSPIVTGRASWPNSSGAVGRSTGSVDAGCVGDPESYRPNEGCAEERAERRDESDGAQQSLAVALAARGGAVEVPPRIVAVG